MKIDILVKFCTFFSFWLQFERVVNGSGGQKCGQGSISIWSNGIQCKKKQGKNFSAGHRSSFWIKLSFGIGHPPAIHQIQCICVGEGSRVPNLQTEFNYLDSFKSFRGLRCLHPMLSPWSPHRLRVVSVIPTLSRRSPYHLYPPDTHSTHCRPPWGGGGPESVKM